MNDNMNPEQGRRNDSPEDFRATSLEPATAGGPSITPEQPADPKRENILNMAFNRPSVEAGRSRTGTTLPGSPRGGGIPRSLKIGGAIAGLGIVLGGAAVAAERAGYFGNDNENDSGNIITVPGENPPVAAPTVEVKIPDFPEKYDFGEDNKYFNSYLDGKIWTGVESGRAEQAHIDYIIENNLFGSNSAQSVDMQPIHKIIVNNPEGLQKAFKISDELQKSLAIDEDGKITPSDFDRVSANINSLPSEEIKMVKDTGFVFKNNPDGIKVFTTQFLGFGKYEDQNSVAYEFFSPQGDASFYNQRIETRVAMVLTLNALNQLIVNSPITYPPDSKFITEQFQPLYAKFSALISPDTLSVE